MDATAALRVTVGLLLYFALNACGGGGDDGPPTPVGNTTVSGVAQKGPFLQGSAVSVQQLNTSLNPSATGTASTVAGGAFGSVEVPRGSLLQVNATGFYFDEINNKVSDTEVTLTAMAQASASSQTEVNVNVLTTLTVPRIKSLMRNGSTFANAKSQAEGEALAPLGLSAIGRGFETLSYSRNSIDDARLLSASAVAQQVAADTTPFLTQFADDLADNGAIDSATLVDQIENAILQVAPAAVAANLTAYYGSISTQATVPDFSGELHLAIALPESFSANRRIEEGTDPFVVLTADRTPHIFYVDVNSRITHAFPIENEAWNSEIIAPMPDFSRRRTSVVLDSDGRFHGMARAIYFTNATPNGTWLSASTPNLGTGDSMVAIAPNGTVGIAYAVSSVFYAPVNAGVIAIPVELGLAADPRAGQNSANVCLAFDDESIPHLFWLAPDDTFTHATTVNDQWVVGTLPGGGNCTGVIVDPSGPLRVAYEESGLVSVAPTMGIGTLTNGNWTTSDTQIPVRQRNFPIRMPNGVIAFLGASASENNLWFSALLPTTVVTTLVATGRQPDETPPLLSSVVRNVSAAVDPRTGRVHIAFFTDRFTLPTVRYTASPE